jgi:hypothetical protein
MLSGNRPRKKSNSVSGRLIFWFMLCQYRSRCNHIKGEAPGPRLKEHLSLDDLLLNRHDLNPPVLLTSLLGAVISQEELRILAVTVGAHPPGIDSL